MNNSAAILVFVFVLAAASGTGKPFYPEIVVATTSVSVTSDDVRIDHSNGDGRRVNATTTLGRRNALQSQTTSFVIQIFQSV